MKILKRLIGLILLMIWAATFGLVGMLGWVPIYIVNPQFAERWLNWFAKTGDVPTLWFTDGEETF